MIYGLTKMKNHSLENANDVINLQIKALKKLRNNLDKSFEDAVKVISNCRNKVIICGVGKSGKIASKISATFSSVGVPSFSVSASDCSHGDLGRITNKDLLMLISYSGNTEELKNIIKYSKQNEICLIGITSNQKSYLYKSANIKLLTPKVEEAGYGIVPTSSTTMQLSLGDALSISVMKAKKFNKLEFKKYHPGGTLGKKLKIVSEIMLKNKHIPIVDENLKMKDAIKTLSQKKLGFILVVNKNNINTGIFTDGDLKRLFKKLGSGFYNFEIKKFMKTKPYNVEENTLATDVLKHMNKRKITGAGVYNKFNKKKIIGVIHIHHLLKALS